MKLLPLLLLIISFSANSASTAHVGFLALPDERRYGATMPRNELTVLNVVRVDCDNALIELEDYGTISLQSTYYQDESNTEFGWGTTFDGAMLCVKMKVTDTNGRESLWSDVFMLPAWNAPEPVQCIAN